ncbi:MAG: isoleucine--tRNA ligase [Candidatus Heimdallarchaeota archaeon]|nr:isoleucine--tRNA ligase [Candidatus Heimdallarchaeota archaeon]
MNASQESDLRFSPVQARNDFSKMEERILEFWESNLVYEKTQEMRKQKGDVYTWLEGPPTANNVPHMGHGLTRTLKDITLRYQTMKGKYVMPRIGGWDCHGLPVELEIEKKMGFNSKNDIEAYGIKEFNQLCRDSVLKYTDDWVRMSKRIGFWLDLDSSYVTMTDNYIESVWWSLKTLYEKGLVYKGTRVAPYCSRCGTTLSSHEMAQGYKDVVDPSIFIKFNSKDMEGVKYLAWTTTPWTLLANVMITVNPDLDYVLVDHEGEKLLLAEGLLEKALKLGKKSKRPEVLQRWKGHELEGKEYEPLFPFFADIGGNAFKVTLAEYVSLESGSGIVHSAPAFGADDAATGNRYGVPVLNPVDLEGKFNETVPPLAGMWVKDADKQIIRMLKDEGKLFRRENYEHSYPHCWRCDTPLLYYGTESWFISMSKLTDNLVKNNNKIYWQPPYIKEGRFGNFISNVVDWNLSRSRYWGTPMPVWSCNSCGEYEFVGGKEELKKKAGKLPKEFELHRPYVDEVTWKCSCGGTKVREEYVIDTWYDSGAAPFAQFHYPFENKEMFENVFPYDFITEAIDQTRGWFYSLLAISTALFDNTSFKSVLCMNHVLAEDGAKMSKSKGNTIEPQEMFDAAGADATRWYLSFNPAWNPMRFGTKLVLEAQRRVINTLWNVYSFFVTNANVDNYNPDKRMKVKERSEIDRWILSRLQGVIDEVEKGYSELAFHSSTKALDYFILEELSNWYVRRSRRRFYSGEMTDDKKSGYDTLYEVLTTLSLIMAPVTPYLSEEIYQNLERRLDASKPLSLHMELFPTSNKKLVDVKLEEKMALALAVTNAGRSARAEAGIKARQPLSEMMVVLEKGEEISPELVHVLKHEINVKELKQVKSDEGLVNYWVQPMLKVLAPQVKGEIRVIKDHLENLGKEEAKRVVQSINRTGSVEMTINGNDWEFNSEELLVHQESTEGYAMGTNRNVSVFIKTELTEELVLEGFSRGIVRYIQEMRKQKDFDYLDRITVSLHSDDAMLGNALKSFKSYIMNETQADSLTVKKSSKADEFEIDGITVRIYVERV